jgi:modulator of FtsH protease HflK
MEYSKYRYQQRDPRDLIIPIALVAGVLLVAFLAFSSIYTVAPNEQAVVLRFGKEHATSPPGLHFCIPLVDRVHTVSIEEHTVRLPFSSEVETGRQYREEDTLMLTGDLNAASVEWTIQWKIHNPRHYLFSFSQPHKDDYIESVIRTAAQTVMNRLVGDYSIDEVLTEKRAEIAGKARDATQEILDQYQCGVAIIDLQLQRVTPPAKVKPAFDEVNSAIQTRDKLISEAKKESEKLLPAAEAKKDEMIQAANGYAKSRRAAVDGELEALRAKYEAYRLAPDVTRRRMYLEAMGEMLKNVESKTIIDADLNKVLPILPLNEGGLQ